MRVSREKFLKNLQSKKFSSAFEAFLFSAGSTSLLRYNLKNVSDGISQEERTRIEELRRLKQRYRTMLYRLRQDELISEKLTVTQRGLEWLKNSLGDGRRKYPQNEYLVQEGNSIVLIIFDIPENRRRYRAWLRNALRNLSFKMIQKSVWMGRTKIPRDFIDDLKRFELVKHVEILEISKTGTIEKLVNN